MIRVAVLGASGRMGRRVIEAILADPETTLAAAIDAPGAPTLGDAVSDIAVTALAPGAFAGAQVLIDFSAPTALLDALPYLGDTALVTGTTGLQPAQQDALAAACDQRAWLQAANFSVGVNVLLDLVERAAARLTDYDLEIVEAHHRHKVDAPSGTALALGRAAATGRGIALEAVATHGREGRPGARPDGEIGFHALRGGDVAGDHTVWIAGAGERLELRHVATSRDTFATGSVRAAKWIAERPAGQYTMADFLGLR